MTAANTKIGVYLDGQLIGNYANTSSNSALNWQALSFGFTGNGQARDLRIVLDGGTDINTAKGAMIDALNVVETLPSTASAVYGMVNSTISLPLISVQLGAGDSATTNVLKTQLLGLPVGAILKDGARTLTVTSALATSGIDLTGWNLNTLTVKPPSNFKGTLNLQVRATSTETANGSTATINRNLTVNVLEGTVTATPVGVNPYVSYVNSTAITSSSFGSNAIVVSALVPVAGSYTFGVSAAAIAASVQADATESDASMEAWMQSLGQSISNAFLAEMERLGR